MFGELNLVCRCLVFISGLMLFYAAKITDILGISILARVIIYQLISNRNKTITANI
ncbi:MAG: hypothetical protein GX075_07655 [Firmicutes bacterium]|nr:hypothetical protein [Bacillota bacterium]